jgi:hypothetical protein
VKDEVDDELEKYKFPEGMVGEEDASIEIEDLAKLRNEYETDVKFVRALRYKLSSNRHERASYK